MRAPVRRPATRAARTPNATGTRKNPQKSGSPSRMKCNWRRWLWGLIPVVMLSWVAVQAERPRIERELTDAASAQALRGGASWAQISFQGRDGVLTGKAWGENDAEAVSDLLRKLPG